MTVPSSVLPTRGSRSGSFDSNEFRAEILIYFLSLPPSYPWHQSMVGPSHSPISSLQPPAYPLAKVAREMLFPSQGRGRIHLHLLESLVSKAYA